MRTPGGQAGRHWRGAGRLFDVLLGLALTILSVALLDGVIGHDPGRPGTVPAYALVLVHGLPLVVRRRWPLAVLGAGIVSGMAIAWLGLPLVVLGLALPVQVYTVAAWRPRPRSLAGLAAAEAGLALVQLAGPNPPDASTWLANSLVVAAAWLLGDLLRRWRERAEAFERLAAELQRAREELARSAVAEERLRIARELHDVVAHSMSVIAVQSGVGAHVLDTRPEEARRALAAIETVSRSALQELRRMLGVLRDPGAGGELAPAPGLDGLGALVDRLAEAGLTVRVRIEGERPEVPPLADLSAYRIVQEALTNVVRHAGPASADVVVRYAANEIDVEVTDDGRGGTSLAAPGGGGQGIAGMRERAAVTGGELEAGPLPGGGFRVAARLPLRGAP